MPNPRNAVRYWRNNINSRNETNPKSILIFKSYFNNRIYFSEKNMPNQLKSKTPKKEKPKKKLQESTQSRKSLKPSQNKTDNTKCQCKGKKNIKIFLYTFNLNKTISNSNLYRLMITFQKVAQNVLISVLLEQKRIGKRKDNIKRI